MNQKQWEPLTTAEAVIEAIKAGRHVEFTACGCDYQSLYDGWICPLPDRSEPDGVREAFRLGEGRRYRALIAPAHPATDVDPEDAELADAIAKGTEAWAGTHDGWVDELRGGAVEPARTGWQPIETAPKAKFDHERWFVSGIRLLLIDKGSRTAYFGAWEYTKTGKGRWKGHHGMVAFPDYWMHQPDPPND